MSVIPSR